MIHDCSLHNAQGVQAAAEYYVRRLAGRPAYAPAGRRRGGRWYPAACERRECCAAVREPSYRFPHSLLRHAYSMTHIAHMFHVDPLALRREIKSWTRPEQHPGPIYVARYWQVSLQRDRDNIVFTLQSPVTGVLWYSADMVAKPYPPNVRNTYGLYGVYVSSSPPAHDEIVHALKEAAIWTLPPCVGVYVYGLMQAYGTVCLHADGIIRAERARIIALGVPREREHASLWVYKYGADAMLTSERVLRSCYQLDVSDDDVVAYNDYTVAIRLGALVSALRARYNAQRLDLSADQECTQQCMRFLRK